MFQIQTENDAKWFVENIQKFFVLQDQNRFSFQTFKPGRKTLITVQVKNGEWSRVASNRDAYDEEFRLIHDPVEYVMRYAKAINHYLRHDEMLNLARAEGMLKY